MAESISTRIKKSRSLTQVTFDLLLSSLDAEPSDAAEKYEHLRRALITFFSFRGATNAEDLTDETFNRVAARLSEGAEIYTNDPAAYFYGVARNVWREALAQKQVLEPFSESFDESAIPQRYAVPDPLEKLLADEQRQGSEARLTCLQTCLQELSPENRALIVDYYQGSGSVKIASRQAIASQLGITLKTLRNKTTLLRSALTECIQLCLEKLAR